MARFGRSANTHRSGNSTEGCPPIQRRIPMTDRFSRDISGRLINRRHLMKGSAALGMAAAAGVGLAPSYQALAQDVVTLKFYHDKSPWQDFYVKQGDLAEK